MALKWEDIDSYGGYGRGWRWGRGYGGLTFIPAPAYEWDGDSIDQRGVGMKP